MNSRQLLFFLDLMLGFVGIMYLMISISSSQGGHAKVRETTPFVLATFEVVPKDTGGPWTALPDVASIVADPGGARVLLARSSAQRFELHLVASGRSTTAKETPGGSATGGPAEEAAEVAALEPAATEGEAPPISVKISSTIFESFAFESGVVRGELSSDGVGLSASDLSDADALTRALDRAAGRATRLPIQFQGWAPQ